MTQLSQVTQLNIYPSSQAGTVAELSDLVTHELVMSGYSLDQDDVQSIILAECRYYSGWAMFEAQKNSVISLDGGLILDAYEWSILEPAIRAHLDLKQAQRMESIKSIGSADFGLSVSEARQIYIQERAEIPKTSFIEPPYSLELD
ncbi:hypothetical protein [Acinetobacter radioresistens]|uniref:hypothetical protein n=1 Tax=Acinetobacter radioresistens TaxID=40216 RepID=UPI00200305EA|nr:hypothetical protein [Acinetobacter radioresistens]MCK4090657.1 hypothetical protein [Acinetobacter radioresistens]MCK4108914.1 hypothetical protein [Acinetobacter radioresistens]